MRHLRTAPAGSLDLLRAAVAHSPVIVYVLDLDGAIVLCEGGGLAGLGCGPEMAAGQSILEWCRDDPAILDQVHLALGGEAVTFVSRVHGVVLEHSLTPRHDDAGHLAGVFGIASTITDRQRVEAALRESEARFRRIVQAAPIGICIMDEVGVFAAVNASYAASVGYTPEELIGKQFGIVIPDDQQDEAQTAFRRVQASSGQNITERTLRCKDGSIRTALGTSIPLQGLDGRPQRAIFVVDIEERKQAEQALARSHRDLERSNAELAQFAYVASHDLQEPLRTITSYLQLLQRRYTGKVLDTAADEFIAYAVDGAQRMQTMIRDVLAYSRVGTHGAAFVHADCTGIVRHVLAAMGTAIEEKKARILYSDLPVIWGDTTQLGQLFQNLIGNALKFCHEAPEVTISAERGDDHWLLRVTDNGIGIDPAFAGRVFEIFKRLHTRTEYPGTGVGLAICKRIVERHGGHIWVESHEGHGASFLFTLPDRRDGDLP